MSEILPVEFLEDHQHGRVVELTGPIAWQHRLEELGVQPGQVLRLVKKGEPCIIALQEKRLSLRCEPGTMILVEVLSSPPASPSCSPA